MEPDAVQALVHAAAAKVQQHIRACVRVLLTLPASVQHPQLQSAVLTEEVGPCLLVLARPACLGRLQPSAAASMPVG